MTKDGARIREANRRQLSFELIDLDALLPGDHPARLVARFVESLDLSELYAAVKAREGTAGRSAADPALLLALWLYATVENIGSARELERRVERDIAYRWIMGGVGVNYHGLSDFRVSHGELLDRLLTESVTALMAEGLVSLEEAIADGTKVKASAGMGSFGGASRFERIERVARERVERLRAEAEAGPGASSRRVAAARERAARELAERAQKAAATLEELRREKALRAKSNPAEEARKGEPKASRSDPEARPMRFPDGGVKAGYNMQVVAASNGFVLALAATSRRNDMGLAGQMMDEIKARYRRLPRRLLLDTKYAAEADIVRLAEDPLGPVTVYTPVPGEVPGDQVKPDTLRRRLAAPRQGTSIPQGLAGAHEHLPRPRHLPQTPPHRDRQRMVQDPRPRPAHLARPRQGKDRRPPASPRP